MASLNEVKEFADASRGCDKPPVSFGFEEFEIADPWHETGPDGRELTDDEARNIYGAENVENYILSASEYIDKHGSEVKELLDKCGGPH